MSQEIVDAVRVLGREKGISEEKLMLALEDALLSAYKKQPGAARYARVPMDRDIGDFRVDELLLPADLEDQLLDEAEEAATLRGAPRRPRDRRGRSSPRRPTSTPRAWPSSRTRSRPATSRRTTSAGSPRRPPSR